MPFTYSSIDTSRIPALMENIHWWCAIVISLATPPARFLSARKIIPFLIHCIDQSQNKIIHYYLLLFINPTFSPPFLCTPTCSSSPSASSSSSFLCPLLVSLKVSNVSSLKPEPTSLSCEESIVTEEFRRRGKKSERHKGFFLLELKAITIWLVERLEKTKRIPLCLIMRPFRGLDVLLFL